MMDKDARFLFIVGCILLFASCNETDPNWYYGYWFSGEKSIIISQPDKVQLNNIMYESVYNATFWSVGDALFVQTGKEQLTLELNPKKKTISLLGDVYEREDAAALSSLYPWLLGKWSSGGHANSPSLVISPTQISYLDANGKVLSKGKYSIQQGEYDYEAKLKIKWNRPNDVNEVRLFIPQESLMVSTDNHDSSVDWFKISNTESSAQVPSSSSSTGRKNSRSKNSTDFWTTAFNSRYDRWLIFKTEYVIDKDPLYIVLRPYNDSKDGLRGRALIMTSRDAFQTNSILKMWGQYLITDVSSLRLFEFKRQSLRRDKGGNLMNETGGEAFYTVKHSGNTITLSGGIPFQNEKQGDSKLIDANMDEWLAVNIPRQYNISF